MTKPDHVAEKKTFNVGAAITILTLNCGTSLNMYSEEEIAWLSLAGQYIDAEIRRLEALDARDMGDTAPIDAAERLYDLASDEYEEDRT